MPQTAILGAGVMGETLLSGLVRAGRRVDNLLVGEKRPERARELEEQYGVAVVSNREAARKADTVALVVKPQDMAALLDEIAAELRPGQLLVCAGRGHHHRLHRVPRARGRRGRPGHAQHPGAGRRGHGGDLARLALRRGAPRRGRVADGLDRPGAADPGAAAGRGHRDQRLRTGVHLLRRRVDDRGRRPPRPAAGDGHRAGRADRSSARPRCCARRAPTRPCCASR